MSGAAIEIARIWNMIAAGRADRRFHGGVFGVCLWCHSPHLIVNRIVGDSLHLVII